LTFPPDLPNVPRVVRGKQAGILGAAVVASFLGAACGSPEPDIQREQAAQKADERFAAGAASFAKYCALCHGRDATGYAADHAPSLVSATFLESASDELIARGIREGRPGTAMAGYAKTRGGPLDDDEIASIIAFLRDRGPARVRLSPAPVLGDATRGEAVFSANCKRCHGTRTERGDAVHLGNIALLLAASDGFLRYAVTHGRPGTPMPAFQGVLREQQIDDVVALLRSWAMPAPPPTPPRVEPVEPPPLGQVVINPNGKNPDFKLREDRYVPIDDVKKAIEAKERVVIIDARAASDWFTMHIPGSISVPYYAFSRLDSLPKDGTWITAYCACPHHASGAVVDELRKRGFPKTAVLDEGILEWKKRDYPIASEPLPPESGTAPPRPTETGAGVLRPTFVPRPVLPPKSLKR
jgi:cytochrome c oxidase cbb3-type subunit III